MSAGVSSLEENIKKSVEFWSKEHKHASNKDLKKLLGTRYKQVRKTQISA
jgi:hypothetical protein